MFKLHPRFDVAVKRVLQASTLYHVVFTRGRRPQWTKDFTKRLGGAVGDKLMKRVRYTCARNGSPDKQAARLKKGPFSWLEFHLVFVHPTLVFHVFRCGPASCHHLVTKHAWAKQGRPLAPRTMPDDTCLGFSIVTPVWKLIWRPSPCWDSVHSTPVTHAMLDLRHPTPAPSL